MLSDNCKSCVHCRWMVGIGFGVRCAHEENQKYKKSHEKIGELPVIISNIPLNCEFHKDKEKGL